MGGGEWTLEKEGGQKENMISLSYIFPSLPVSPMNCYDWRGGWWLVEILFSLGKGVRFFLLRDDLTFWRPPGLLETCFTHHKMLSE